MMLRDEAGVEPSVVEEVAPGVIRVPLRTATLPPASRTNVYLVRGVSGLWVVDPGASDARENERLLGAVHAAERRWGVQTVGCILTHHHPDHTSGLGWWSAAFDGPVVAERRTVALVREAAETREAAASVTWRAVDEDTSLDGLALVFTPGHAPGHLAVWTASGHAHLAPKVLMAGDLVAGIGTIVVNPPRGHMTDYLASLRRAAALGPELLLPSHGPGTDAAVERLEFYVAHRLAREAKVLAGVASDWSDSMTITRAAYQDVQEALHVFAERSALAHLAKLVEDGAVACDGSPYAVGARFRLVA